MTFSCFCVGHFVTCAVFSDHQLFQSLAISPDRQNPAHCLVGQVLSLASFGIILAIINTIYIQIQLYWLIVDMATISCKKCYKVGPCKKTYSMISMSP